MSKVIRLTESDLTRIVNRVLNEQVSPGDPILNCIKQTFNVDVKKVGQRCLAVVNTISRGQDPSGQIFGCLFELGISGIFPTKIPSDTEIQKFNACIKQQTMVKY